MEHLHSKARGGRPSACHSIPPTFPQEIPRKTHTFPPLVNKNITYSLWTYNKGSFNCLESIIHVFCLFYFPLYLDFYLIFKLSTVEENSVNFQMWKTFKISNFQTTTKVKKITITDINCVIYLLNIYLSQDN